MRHLDHWKPQAVRPPSEGSLFTVSYLALRGLKMFGTYYESGYPHGKDQFISITAASWTTTALALALPATR